MRCPATANHIIEITIILCIVAGCGDDGGGADASPSAGTAEIGTGTVEFLPLSPDQDLELIAGPQGGYHFIVHARIDGLLPGDPDAPGALGNPQTRFALYLEDGSRVDAALPPYRLGYRESDAGLTLPSGRILQLDNEQALAGLVPAIYGQRVRITLEVRDAAGAIAEDEQWITAIASDALGADAGPGDAGPGDAGT